MDGVPPRLSNHSKPNGFNHLIIDKKIGSLKFQPIQSEKKTKFEARQGPQLPGTVKSV